MPEIETIDTRSVEATFGRYHVGWETRNPELIASLHSADTVFQLHDGAAPINGRDALRIYCTEMFRQFDFKFEMGRFFCGSDHWVFEWAMVLDLTDVQGAPFTARIEMLDLVTMDSDFLVTRKDVYMNGDQAGKAFARAGIQR